MVALIRVKYNWELQLQCWKNIDQKTSKNRPKNVPKMVPGASPGPPRGLPEASLGMVETLFEKRMETH